MQKFIELLKKNKKLSVIIALLIFILLCCCSILIIPQLAALPDDQLESSSPDPEVQGTITEGVPTYKVTSITDGDTIKLEIDGIEEKVRLVGIDTPELKDPNKPVQCFAQEASKKMTELLDGKRVTIEYDSQQGKRDQYDRLLLYIRLEDKTFVNDYMVREGYAYAYKQLPSDYLEQFSQAEEQARTQEKGLWGDVCKCSEKLNQEKSRSCTGCKEATVEYYEWDCTTRSESIIDNSCTSTCPVTYTPKVSTKPAPTWPCDCSKTCAQISSCAEAQYLLNTCGCSARDGDNDGVACDSMCQ